MIQPPKMESDGHAGDSREQPASHPSLQSLKSLITHLTTSKRDDSAFHKVIDCSIHQVHAALAIPRVADQAVAQIGAMAAMQVTAGGIRLPPSPPRSLPGPAATGNGGGASVTVKEGEGEGPTAGAGHHAVDRTAAMRGRPNTAACRTTTTCSRPSSPMPMRPGSGGPSRLVPGGATSHRGGVEIHHLEPRSATTLIIGIALHCSESTSCDASCNANAAQRYVVACVTLVAPRIWTSCHEVATHALLVGVRHTVRFCAAHAPMVESAGTCFCMLQLTVLLALVLLA